MRSEWPTTDAERVAWCELYGLQPVGTKCRSILADEGESFEAPDEPGGEFGWHTFHGEFVGVHWFCWAGLPRESVRERANVLRHGLIDGLGTPEDQTGIGTPHLNGFTAHWTPEGRSVELYYHSGIHELRDGQPSDNAAVVQLAVDDAVRTEALEAAHEAAATDDYTSAPIFG